MARIGKVSLFAAILGLAGCGGTDLERGLTGAGLGAVTAIVLDGSVVVGVVVGGAAGVFCDDIGMCP